MSDDGGRLRHPLSRLIPRAWRDAVLEDLEDEVGSQHRGRLWLALQTLRVGLRLRWSLAADMLLVDLLIAGRTLLKWPGFSFAAIATLAVGVAATTAIFSTVNAALLRPLPFPEPGDLYSFGTTLDDGRFATGLIASAESAALNERATTVVRAVVFRGSDESLVANTSAPGELARGVATEGRQISIVGVSEGFFEMFGVPLVLGPGFTSDDYAPLPPAPLVLPGRPAPPSAPPPGTVTARTTRIVLSHRLWRAQFAGDPSIVGRTVGGSAGLALVVGVAAEGFEMPRGADAWSNMRVGRSISHIYEGYLRARPGTTPRQLTSELAAVMASVTEEFPEMTGGRRYTVEPLADHLIGDLKPILLLVFGGTLLLLLLACVNVTNLLLARGATRTRDFALRAAIGAGRRHIVRQMLSESLVLATAGALVGVLVAYAGVRFLLYAGASQLPGLSDVPFDGGVLGFALVVLVTTAALIGVAPALRFARVDLRGLLNNGGRGVTAGRVAHRILSVMIVAEIALAMVLVSGAGWLTQSFANLTNVDPGFTARGRLAFDLFRRTDTPLTAEQRSRLTARWNELPDRLRAIPGVTGIGSSSTIPLRGERNAAVYVGTPGEADSPKRERTARLRYAGPGFFQAMGVRILAGREFTAEDRTMGMGGSAVVNEAFMDTYLRGQDPLTAYFFQGFPTANRSTPVAIVGVVANIHYTAVGERPEPAFYMRAGTGIGSSLVLATDASDPLSLVPSIRTAIHEIDPTVPVMVESMESLVARSLGRQRLGMMLMLVFAGSALALAAIGIYGVIAYVSAQRLGEVATRMALGATPSEIFWMLMRQGRSLAVTGTATGIVAAYASGRLVTSWLYEVQASDPVVVVTAIAFVVGITAVAVALPARRASQIDLAHTLRLE